MIALLMQVRQWMQSYEILFTRRNCKMYVRHEWSKANNFLISFTLITDISQPYSKIEQIAI